MSVLEEINRYNRNDYQRDNFDAFLRKIGFKYDIPSIHVSGTNGKGSTCNYINNIYIASGKKVGLFISPCYESMLDMIRVNNEFISISFVENTFKEYKKYFDKFDLSSFEIVTFIAFKYFIDQKVDIALIECGMGGEIDATNIFKPILSIITNITSEHTNFLGVSISEIALHKAGIIKNEVPLLIGEIEGDALDVLVNKAKETKSKIYKVDHYHSLNLTNEGYTFEYRPYNEVKIPSKSLSSVSDACLALEAVNILQDTYPVDINVVKEGLYKPTLDSRFNIIEGKPTFVIDGAHNPDAIIKLRKDMELVFPGKVIHIVFASFKDKNITVMLPEIGLLGELLLTTFAHSRAREESDYFLYLEDYKFHSDHKELIKSLKETYPEDVILITGSLAFANLVKKEITNGEI